MEDSKSKKNGIVSMKFIVSILAVLSSLYHMMVIEYSILPIFLHRVIHLSLAMIICCILVWEEQKNENRETLFTKIINGLFIILVLIQAVFIIVNFETMLYTIGIPTMDITIIGILALILIMMITKQIWGKIIPTIMIIGLLYGYFGYYFPGILNHPGLRLQRLVGYAVTNFQGIYGSLTALSSREVYLFILLGAFMQAAGAIDLFMSVAKGVGGSLQSGPAQGAVISSAFLGSVTGNITSNVATTGSITIPTMIRLGYSREYAGAIEAAASTGAQLIPPVLGLSAFVMVSYTGVPYSKIMIVSLLPSLIYYFFLAFNIHCRSIKLGLKADKQESGIAMQAIKEKGFIVLPLFVLIVLLLRGLSVANAALYTIIAMIIAVGIKYLYISKLNLNMFFKKMGLYMYEALREGGITALKIALMMASLGVMIEIFTVTGFAQKMSYSMVELSGGSLIILLFLVAFTCIVFGMGMPTVGAYITVAVLGAPALEEFGIPIIIAHFFVFYYALMGSVTPPVCGSVYVATAISGGNFFKTAMESVRLALPGFLLPFYFIFRPNLLLIENNFFISFIVFIAILFSIISIEAIYKRFMFTKLYWSEVILLFLCIPLSFNSSLVFTFISIILFIFVFLKQFRRYKNSIT